MTPESMLLLAWLEEAEAPVWVMDGVADALPKIEAGAREAFRSLRPLAAPEPSAALVEAFVDRFFGDATVREDVEAIVAAARAEGLDGRPAGWSATWRDDVTGAGLTRDEAIAALVDLAREHAALERYYLRLRDTGLAMFPDSAWLLVEGDTIRLNRTAAEAFSVALAEAPAARRTPEAARG